MSTILGIDPGMACGWAVLDDGKRIASGTWALKGKRHEGGGMRYLRFRRSLIDAIVSARPHAVAYEEVRRHAGTSAAHVYGGIVAVIGSVCEEHAIPYLGVPVGTVKRAATGKGNAPKAAMVRSALERWGLLSDPGEDEADALWIAWAAGVELYGWDGAP